MVVRHAQAELCVDGEPAVGREQGERGRLERILRREHDLAMVHAPGVVCVLGALNHKVPLQQVVRRVRADVRHGVLHELLVFLLEPRHACLVARHAEVGTMQ